ncbi:TetR/AcrR family transcriptional regulator [Curtobacterium flaccumfaciens]|jgi:AcrR family transcriptional regulator|uniref:TetR/AcrR family transcriptional regulator n=1 Tax=Curtobacterium flaccumfaciens TaxID=2035 RepID=UPI001BE03F3E|nr:TetR/AcrR family transcriptional regulator [Curtobacterium flaccumfaciens]MBT1583348.1 TetR family transcriptional regulator [Curtobacterium flaccumfaciens pv. flaccumfaciens]MCS5494986.1 TetR/AcrR family transcriptional regulator [Curtobacterium flaccumfaciens pv. flaccumfaciens]MCX2799455.1 TetR family transcriptional regulator [Curtobacterium flaccumfaciens pv. flaccumfaciens]
MDEPIRRGGRPRRSSAEVLADAAAELFLEQGYGRTTVDQIAARAGVSRATFFNYFTAKSDVMWLELDAAVAGLPGYLAASTEPSVVRAVEQALLAAARAHDPERVPWAVAQAEVMGIGSELVASVANRVTDQHATVAAFVAARTGDHPAALWPQTVSGAMLGAAGAAFGVWVADGVGRRPLVEYVGAALTPVASGLDAH